MRVIGRDEFTADPDRYIAETKAESIAVVDGDRVVMVLSSPEPTHISMGYVLLSRERGEGCRWVRVDEDTGRPHLEPRAHHATVWGTPINAQGYAKHFAIDVEVVPVCAHVEGERSGG